ncbi:MAG: TIGR00730 family Rossman fold protein [Actinomycetota bacterium]
MTSSICVFCGSSRGDDPVYAEVATELGSAIARGRHRLVYGGGNVGLMGAVAGAALALGGDVTGVITDALVRAEVAHDDLSELEVTASMHERKALMAAHSDAAIVLPGGFGTLDEVFELLTWNQLGLVSMPVVFLDVNGFFDALFHFVDHAIDQGFVPADHRLLANRAGSVDEALRLALAAPADVGPKWLDR